MMNSEDIMMARAMTTMMQPPTAAQRLAKVHALMEDLFELLDGHKASLGVAHRALLWCVADSIASCKGSDGEFEDILSVAVEVLEQRARAARTRDD